MPVAEIRDYEEIPLSFYSGRARHSRWQSVARPVPSNPSLREKERSSKNGAPFFVRRTGPSHPTDGGSYLDPNWVKLLVVEHFTRKICIIQKNVVPLHRFALGAGFTY